MTWVPSLAARALQHTCRLNFHSWYFFCRNDLLGCRHCTVERIPGHGGGAPFYLMGTWSPLTLTGRLHDRHSERPAAPRHVSESVSRPAVVSSAITLSRRGLILIVPADCCACKTGVRCVFFRFFGCFFLRCCRRWRERVLRGANGSEVEWRPSCHNFNPSVSQALRGGQKSVG